jgi:hypothetical protein
MSNGDPRTLLLTNYIASLAERTRVEKSTTKYGFDWIIYNLAIANNWTPVRLPFFRRPKARTARAKTEAEFGIDMSFVPPGKRELVIFVLKAEELKSRNWISHRFDHDLRMAAYPDLSPQQFRTIKRVKVILTYNKDEDKTGIDLFQRLAKNLSGKRAGNRTLSFERWNLSRIVEEVEIHLFSPALMPQHLSNLLFYISAQVHDFDYGSKEWEEQLLPNWKNFLKMALQEPVDERKLRLVPVALLILHHYRKQVPNSYPGWIDLLEWAILSLWSSCRNSRVSKLKSIVFEIWAHFYISQLGIYLLEVSQAFTTEHGFHSSKRGVGLQAITDSYITYWHIARLGIYGLALQEALDARKESAKELLSQTMNRNAYWLSRCLCVNPASLRPLADINHIELFLIWLTLWQTGKREEIFLWLSELEPRLLVRRIGKVNVPFIESRSRMDLIAEFAATGTKPPGLTTSSSYLLLMILELCFSLPAKERDELLDKYYRRIILAGGDDGKPLADDEIELTAWLPRDEWGPTILTKQVTGGTAIMTNNFEAIGEESQPLSERIREFVNLSRNRFAWKIPKDLPPSVFILACLKHKSPLPPEFWRALIFPSEEPDKT